MEPQNNLNARLPVYLTRKSALICGNQGGLSQTIDEIHRTRPNLPLMITQAFWQKVMPTCSLIAVKLGTIPRQEDIWKLD